MKVVVTGGAGFVGKYLVSRLLEQGIETIIFDDFSDSSKEDIAPQLNLGAKLAEEDICNYSAIESSLEGVDSVVHLAAKIDVQESIKKPEFYNKINVQGTKNLLDACVKKGVKNVIAASSAAIYGAPKELPILEDSSLEPLSPYGQTKVEMENLLENYAKNHDLSCVSLRFFNVYGKGQTDAYAGVITKFLQNIKNEKPLVIFGDGTNTRDFVAVEDVVDAIYNTLQCIQGKKGNRYNIATGKFTTINDLANLMLEISGKKLKIIHDPPRKGDILHSQTNIELAQKELNFDPKITLREGLKKLF